jgi:hypothetical protein
LSRETELAKSRLKLIELANGARVGENKAQRGRGRGNHFLSFFFLGSGAKVQVRRDGAGVGLWEETRAGRGGDGSSALASGADTVRGTVLGVTGTGSRGRCERSGQGLVMWRRGRGVASQVSVCLWGRRRGRGHG